ncbi:hypothetical protein J437_LFUL006884 [Ladona fulva]|uniref:Uncharacterized protein n=1 Tax=Ladona fulva TaxID=123851 RepID=A0A8K0KH53_LADFU|nr:hypothetical protein J437_LFUL006884 [Ladona fulva]
MAVSKQNEQFLLLALMFPQFQMKPMQAQFLFWREHSGQSRPLPIRSPLVRCPLFTPISSNPTPAVPNRNLLYGRGWRATIPYNNHGASWVDCGV